MELMELLDLLELFDLLELLELLEFLEFLKFLEQLEFLKLIGLLESIVLLTSMVLLTDFVTMWIQDMLVHIKMNRYVAWALICTTQTRRETQNFLSNPTKSQPEVKITARSDIS